MCRISPVDPNAATGVAREVLDAVKTRFGMVPMMARTMAQSGAVVAGWAALSDALAEGVLDARTRELIALAVSQANACNYCLAAHTALGETAGLTTHERTEARRGRATDAKEAAAIRLALAILDTQGAVSDDALLLARAAGLSDAELGEVTAHVALNVLTNYFNRLADTDIDFPKVDVRLPDHSPRIHTSQPTLEKRLIMKIVFVLLATLPLSLLACSKDEPSDGGKMAPSQAMAPASAMAAPGTMAAPGPMAAPGTMAAPGPMAAPGAMAAPGTMASGSAMKPAPGAGHM